jgi:RsiW-degrading membrane proteinase PrsW (M82 family)
MVLDVYCVCGKLNTANEDMAGQQINCIRCGRMLQVPELPKQPEPDPDVAPDIPATRPVAAPPPAGSGSLRDYLYWLLPLFLLPLAIGLGLPETETIEQRLQKTIESTGSPQEVRELWKQIEAGEASLDSLFPYLPDHKLVGAWLPRHSHMHWAFMLASAIALGSIVGFSFAPGSAKPLHLVGVGLFTATCGVCILLLLHYFTPTAIFLQAAEMSDALHKPDFFGSLAYYTLAVGLFEEAVKLLPVGWYLYRYGRLEWRMACLWGLASGIGFGISEGAMYSESLYHGIAAPLAYLERFASCVTLHAVWTASAAVSLYHCQDLVRVMLHWDERELRMKLAAGKDAPLYMAAQPEREFDWTGFMIVLVRVLIVVMFLHGLYDAALARELIPLALFAAIISFGWLAWQIEDARNKEQPAAASTAA